MFSSKYKIQSTLSILYIKYIMIVIPSFMLRILYQMVYSIIRNHYKPKNTKWTESWIVSNIWYDTYIGKRSKWYKKNIMSARQNSTSNDFSFELLVCCVGKFFFITNETQK